MERVDLANLGADELAPLAVAGSMLPAWGLFKRLGLYGDHIVSRKTSIKQVDFALTPIDTYVTRVQRKIATSE